MICFFVSGISKISRCHILIKDDRIFSHSKSVLESKRKSLKSHGKGNKKLKAAPLQKEDIMLLYERNVLDFFK
jgi:hypothetical protein